MNSSLDAQWGIIGFGAVGSTFAHHIGNEAGCRVKVTDVLLNEQPPPDHFQRRLAGSAVQVVSDIRSLVLDCDVVLSVVTPSAAAKVARLAAADWRQGLFIDFNSVSPSEKREMSAFFQSDSYVDGCILGSIDAEGAGASLALAGPRSPHAHRRLSGAHFRSSLVGSEVGAASALKMCRSIFMKGVECLLVEMLLAAARFNVTEQVLLSIEDTLSSYDIRSLVNMLVTTHAPHCGRRSEEMQRAAEMLTALDLPALMSSAACNFLNASRHAGLPAHCNHRVPKEQNEVIDFLARFYEGRLNGVAQDELRHCQGEEIGQNGECHSREAHLREPASLAGSIILNT
jgi:3-hydroxyisobutyrate dehydrogenase-like beta-hydroxyacid dehydrogenase